ncbi:hypothetical protein [Halotia branconii]|uniref:POLO box domain-containing protein n=1 Tax=Halotia branconii CENA392 TaxID=1539056 RepID=A0AAJ6NMY0_9CYAN|nr:hypothetical protein [Halotia branconii]WGV23348.1 hypothetical protein QI031_16100 [Halotia branconii CENA392]
MSIQFNQKLRYTLGIVTLLFISLAGSYVYKHSNNQQLAQPQTTLKENSTFGAKTALATSVQNSVLVAETSNQAIGKPNSAISKKFTASVPITYPVIDEWKKYKFSINGSKILTPVKLPKSQVNFNQTDLLTVLINTRKYFQDHASEDPDIFRKGILGTQGVNIPDMLKTLDFMITTLNEDIANQRTTRLQDPNFINANFRVIKWSAYNPNNQKQERLRITKYAVFTHPGSRTKTSTYNTPIYSLKANSKTDTFYTKYTKQDVLSGIYEPGGKEFGKVEPLAYLTRNGLEEALMQGTVLINFTDGSKAFFNVDKNNGISYVRGLKATAQKRYWYFRQVDAIKGYGHTIDAKISVKPGVTFAGDVLNIGLGKVIVIEHTKSGRKHLQMGVIADTGGAFLPNLYQLDFLAGIFQSQKDFQQHIQRLPEYANAYVLVKK